MSDTESTSSEIEVEVAARPETVFACLVEGEALTAWLGAGFGTAEIQPRVGGALRVTYPGATKVAGGEVVTLDAPHAFAFTWGFADGMPFPLGSTRVSLALTAAPPGTHVHLTHEGLPSEAAARDHAGGWQRCLSLLSALAAVREGDASSGG